MRTASGSGGGDHGPDHHPLPLLQGDQPGGAHNQRGEVRVQVRYKKFFWIEDLIRLVEESASCEVYALLKRQDEKFVTEKAYSNPMFVEDVVREIAHHLSQDDNFSWYAVESENFESIHNHSAYAYIESK